MENLALSRDVQSGYIEKARDAYNDLRALKPTVDTMQAFVDAALYSGVEQMADIVHGISNDTKPIEKVAAFGALLNMSKHLQTRNPDNKGEEDESPFDNDYEEVMGHNVKEEAYIG